MLVYSIHKCDVQTTYIARCETYFYLYDHVISCNGSIFLGIYLQKRLSFIKNHPFPDGETTRGRSAMHRRPSVGRPRRCARPPGSALRRRRLGRQAGRKFLQKVMEKRRDFLFVCFVWMIFAWFFPWESLVVGIASCFRLFSYWKSRWWLWCLSQRLWASKTMKWVCLKSYTLHNEDKPMGVGCPMRFFLFNLV